MNYDRLTTAECPKGPRATPLRVKVAGALVMAAFWGLFLYTVYRWAEF